MNKPTVYTAAALVVLAGALGFNAAYQTTPTPETVTVAPSVSPSTEAVDRGTYTVTDAKLTIDPTAEMKFAPVLEPADFTNVFQLVDSEHGYLRTGGTTYLVAHSYAKGSGAPGNAWETLVVGDLVIHGGQLYEVDLVATPGHGDIADQPVWTNDPETLVLITCLSRGAGNAATNNYVIRAHRV